MQAVGFTPPNPLVRDLLNGFWRLEEAMLYTAPDLRQWLIPSGFVTDFGSIPEFLEWIPGLQGTGSDADPAYLIHDWLYASHRAGCPRCRDRLDADRIMLDALAVCGVGRVRRSVIFAGVRLGGWAAWNRKAS